MAEIDISLCDAQDELLVGPLHAHTLPGDFENGFALARVRGTVAMLGRASFVIESAGSSITVPIHFR